MHPGDATATGLRERKKQRTRETILARARDLFEAQGFAETTIAQIAEAAEVSPRTVSSYFPEKEELVFPDKDAMLASVSEAMEERAEGEVATDALRRWLLEHFADPESEDHAHKWQRALIDEDPDLRAFERRLQEDAEQVIAEAVAVDLSLPADHHLPRMVAATTMAALDSLGRDDPAAHSPEQSRRLIEDAMQFVGAGVRKLQGG
jgi:AcrR family transcriptional regulator